MCSGVLLLTLTLTCACQHANLVQLKHDTGHNVPRHLHVNTVMGISMLQAFLLQAFLLNMNSVVKVAVLYALTIVEGPSDHGMKLVDCYLPPVQSDMLSICTHADHAERCCNNQPV